MVDVCLIPEVEFSEDNLIAYVQKLLEKKGHTVICIAEGAGVALITWITCAFTLHTVEAAIQWMH